ncbi:MAG: hypothetical protein AB7T38_02630 [Nitrospirales bacterium]
MIADAVVAQDGALVGGVGRAVWRGLSLVVGLARRPNHFLRERDGRHDH